jgi:4-hydroxy-3-polyprenylbenzoate decarboxylase
MTHKRNAVYPATIVGIPPQEDAWLGKATERIFLAPIKMTMVPEITDMDMPVEGVFHNLVIAKIQKEYAGQGQKVMNAMWGAGQMMFNKILVVVSDDAEKISNYKKLAQTIFKNLNPATDIYFSQGPMDVLDHSCSKLGFGGKMCIDGTYKYNEEMDEKYEFGNGNLSLSEAILKNEYAEIKGVNISLLKDQIPCIIISVKKTRLNHVKELHEKLGKMKEMVSVKMILYVEHTVNASDLPVALWRFCNNLDPKRDYFLSKNEAINSGGKYNACIGLDGTIKTKEFDNFERDWPNIIVSNEETIRAVDSKWKELGIGSFIPSPSLKFRDQLYGEEAVVHSI